MNQAHSACSVTSEASASARQPGQATRRKADHSSWRNWDSWKSWRQGTRFSPDKQQRGRSQQKRHARDAETQAALDEVRKETGELVPGDNGSNVGNSRNDDASHHTRKHAYYETHIITP